MSFLTLHYVIPKTSHLVVDCKWSKNNSEQSLFWSPEFPENDLPHRGSLNPHFRGSPFSRHQQYLHLGCSRYILSTCLCCCCPLWYTYSGYKRTRDQVALSFSEATLYLSSCHVSAAKSLKLLALIYLQVSWVAIYNHSGVGQFDPL